MPDPGPRPLLFLDVDGPLIPFGVAAQAPATGSAYWPLSQLWQVDPNPLLTRLDPEHGRRLLALPCDLVWATTWMAEANEIIAPRIGLPELPVVDWPDTDEDGGGLHWKTRGLVEWAGGRSFVWIDDEITEADRVWVSAHHDGSALLHRVDPRQGLTGADFAIVAAWLARF